MSLKYILIAAATLAVAYGNFMVPCRDSALRPAENFDIERYSGKEWYTIALAVSDSDMIPPVTTKCESETFTSTAVPLAYRVNAQSVVIADNSNVSFSLIVNTDSNDPAVMNFDIGEGETTAVLLATDYESWSLFYRCTVGADNKNVEHAVIRSRVRTLDSGIYDFLKSWSVGLGFPEENIVLPSQTGC